MNARPLTELEPEAGAVVGERYGLRAGTEAPIVFVRSVEEALLVAWFGQTLTVGSNPTGNPPQEGPER